MISFFVPGRPQAQGSKVKGRWGNLREDNDELGPWRERVAMAAYGALCEVGDDDEPMLEGPVSAALEFVLYRPLSTPKTKTPPATKKPDLDKMVRAVGDALTGVVWGDDAQLVALWATKRVARLGENPGVHVWVGVAPNTPPTP